MRSADFERGGEMPWQIQLQDFGTRGTRDYVQAIGAQPYPADAAHSGTAVGRMCGMGSFHPARANISADIPNVSAGRRGNFGVPR